MNDRKISAGHTIAYAMWGVAAALIAAMWITGERRLGATALMFVGIAATATVRCYFVEFGKVTWSAFELGRESATQAPSNVRTMH